MTAIYTVLEDVSQDPSYSTLGWSDHALGRAEEQVFGIPANYHQPSREYFRRLAEFAPDRLVALLCDDALDPADLTFAAEIAGEIRESQLVLAPLLKLLDHSSSLVREGTIYGLAPHRAPHIDSAFRKLMADDPSPGVRAAAADVLEG